MTTPISTNPIAPPITFNLKSQGSAVPSGGIIATVNIVWVARVATEAQIAQRHLADLRRAARLIGENCARSPSSGTAP